MSELAIANTAPLAPPQQPSPSPANDDASAPSFGDMLAQASTAQTPAPSTPSPSKQSSDAPPSKDAAKTAQGGQPKTHTRHHGKNTAPAANAQPQPATAQAVDPALLVAADTDPAKNTEDAAPNGTSKTAPSPATPQSATGLQAPNVPVASAPDPTAVGATATASANAPSASDAHTQSQGTKRGHKAKESQGAAAVTAAASPALQLQMEAGAAPAGPQTKNDAPPGGQTPAPTAGKSAAAPGTSASALPAVPALDTAAQIPPVIPQTPPLPQPTAANNDAAAAAAATPVLGAAQLATPKFATAKAGAAPNAQDAKGNAQAQPSGDTKTATAETFKVPGTAAGNDPAPKTDATKPDPATATQTQTAPPQPAAAHVPATPQNTIAAQPPAPQTPAAPETATIRVADAATKTIPPDQVAYEIKRSQDAGTNHFQIRLDPPELGRIEVKLDVSADGTTKAHLIADRQDTLDMLQRDSGALDRSLQSLGLKTGDNSLSFSLRQDDNAMAGGNARGDQQTNGNANSGSGAQGSNALAADDDIVLPPQYANQIYSDPLRINIVI